MPHSCRHHMSKHGLRVRNAHSVHLAGGLEYVFENFLRIYASSPGEDLEDWREFCYMTPTRWEKVPT